MDVSHSEMPISWPEEWNLTEGWPKLAPVGHRLNADPVKPDTAWRRRVPGIPLTSDPRLWLSMSRRLEEYGTVLLDRVRVLGGPPYIAAWLALVDKELGNYFQQHGKPPTQKTKGKLQSPLYSWKQIDRKLTQHLQSSLPKRCTEVLHANHKRICTPIEEISLEQIDVEIRELVSQKKRFLSGGRQFTLRTRLRQLGVAKTLRERAVQLGLARNHRAQPTFSWNSEWSLDVIESSGVAYWKQHGHPPRKTLEKVPGMGVTWKEVILAYDQKHPVKFLDRLQTLLPVVTLPDAVSLQKAQSGAEFIRAFDVRVPLKEILETGKQFGHELSRNLIHQIRYLVRRSSVDSSPSQTYSLPR